MREYGENIKRGSLNLSLPFSIHLISMRGVLEYSYITPFLTIHFSLKQYWYRHIALDHSQKLSTMGTSYTGFSIVLQKYLLFLSDLPIPASCHFSVPAIIFSISTISAAALSFLDVTFQLLECSSWNPAPDDTSQELAIYSCMPAPPLLLRVLGMSIIIPFPLCP